MRKQATLKNLKIVNYKLKINLRVVLVLLGMVGVVGGVILFINHYHHRPPTLKLSPTPATNQYLYQNKSKGFAVYLGSRSTKQTPEVKMAVENSSIDFKPENNVSDQTKMTKQDEKSIIYKNIYPGIDLRYSLTEKGVKEEIIISNQQSAISNQQFTFKLNLNNTIPKKDPMGNLTTTFIDPISGNYLFHFAKPFMVDAGGNRSEQVDLKIQQDSSLFRVVLIPDQNWLKTALYPVIIDPTIVHDTSSEFASGQFNRLSDTGYNKTLATSASGGTITHSGGYTIHTFTSTSTFTPDNAMNVEILVVAGGGGGSGGGGGAGGLVYASSYAVTQGIGIGVTVGGGGAGGNPGVNGSNSVFGNITALGGGGGGKDNFPGNSGGSGGGPGASSTGDKAAGAATQGNSGGGTGYGNASGSTPGSTNPYPSAGGGGAGAVGQTPAVNATTSGNGGIGRSYDISGVATYYAGGGGGGNSSTSYIGIGGSGGGGNAGSNGTANTGGGGGGVYAGVAGAGNGGSGVVIVRYPTVYLDNIPSIELTEQELPTDINTRALYHFSNGVCTTDSSGNGYTLTANGGMTCSTGGKLGYKASGFATTPVSYSQTTVLDAALTSGTIEVWINPANLTGTQTILYADSTSDTLLTLGSSGQINFSTSGSTTLTTANSLVSASTWTHIAATWTSAGHKIFVNGVEQTSDANTTTHSNQDYTTYIGIGAGGNTNAFSGSIDEVRISSVARTSEEIKLDAQKRPYGIYTSSSIDLGTYSSLDSLQWAETIPSSTAPSGLPTTDIEFQTRTSANNSTWEEWRPTGVGSTAIDSMDSLSNWTLPSSSIWSGVPISTAPETTIKIEGTGSMKTIVGAPLVDANTKALWHFDETGVGTGSTAYDSSGNNHHGVATGTTLTEGFYGKARSFDGSSSKIALTQHTDLKPTGAFSINVWANIADMSATRPIIQNMYWDGGGIWGYYFVAGTFQIGRGNWNLDDGYTSASWTPAIGVMQMTTVTMSSAGLAKVYLDGVFITSGRFAWAPMLPTYHASAVPYIGHMNVDSKYFSGSIDELELFNTALSDEQIAEAYRAGRDHRIERTLSSTDLSSKNKVPFYIAADRPGTYLETYTGETSNSVYGADANTKGLWHLDEKSGSGAYIKDSSGNSMHGTPTVTTFTQGKVGSGRYFDGSSYITVTDNAILEPSNLTISAWVKTSQSGTNYVGIVDKYTGSAAGYMLDLPSGTDMYPRMHVTTSSSQNVIATSAINDNLWHFIVGTYDGTNCKIYIDGNLNNSNGCTGTITYDGHNLIIGGDGASTNRLVGFLDEVSISNTARTTDQIRQAYQYGLRTHQITIDYSTGIGSSAPTSTSDVDFNPTTTTNLYVGDMVIVREKVATTTYIMQGEVTSISSGIVTVASWSGTAPPSGYTINANVFKWQREYWDISDIPTGDRDAITKLGLRVLDGYKGFDMYLDDFRSNQNYLTDPTGSTITSTAQRYFQYRSILTTNDTLVSPSLTSVTLNYMTNQTPTAPTSLLTEGQTNPSNVIDTTPEFSAIYNDSIGDIANKYRIQVDDDPAFGSTLWDSGASGTTLTPNCTAVNRCTDISYGGASTDLQWNTKYYWRIKYWDDEPSEGYWSTESAYFTMSPITPTGCQIDDSNHRRGILVVKWQDNTTLETGYRVERSVNGGAFALLSTEAADTTSKSDNTVAGNNTYQYQIRANSSNGNSDFCITSTVNLGVGRIDINGLTVSGMTVE